MNTTPDPKLDKSFPHFVSAELAQLCEAFGMKPEDLLASAIDETRWETIWRENAQGALNLYRKERKRNMQLLELLWVILNKKGGEVRLGINDVAPEKWEIEEHTDPGTLDRVIKTRVGT